MKVADGSAFIYLLNHLEVQLPSGLITPYSLIKTAATKSECNCDRLSIKRRCVVRLLYKVHTAYE